MSRGHVALLLGMQMLLTVCLVVVSYLAPPWSPAFADIRLWVRTRLLPLQVSPQLLNVSIPLIVVLMVIVQEVAISALRRSATSAAKTWLVRGTVVLVAISVLIFPVGSQDLELYHAHAQMVAREHANPYAVSPTRALGSRVSPTVTWGDQLAPYGPLAIGVEAATVGHITNGWIAALLLKAVYTLPTLVFVLVVATWKSAGESQRLQAVVTAGWQPLLMLEFGGGGHCDGLMWALCALAILVSTRARPLLAGALLGLASLVKVEALVFLPLLVAWESRDRGRGRGGERLLARRAAVASAAVVVAIVVMGYLAFGGPHVALPGLRAEAAKIMRSVPQAVSYVAGAAAVEIAAAMRVAFLAGLAAIAVMVARRGLPIVAAAPLAYGLYMVLAKSFLQPWHGAALVFFLAVSRVTRARDGLLSLAVGSWSFFAVLGGYTFVMASRSLVSKYQALSTLIMVGPTLVAVLCHLLTTRGKTSAA